jgi:hypothetical protein
VPPVWVVLGVSQQLVAPRFSAANKPLVVCV